MTVRAGTAAATLPAGYLVTDYYGTYNHLGSAHQRCWVHLSRDLHALKEAHASDVAVVHGAREVRALYDDAGAAFGGLPVLTARQLEAQSYRLAAVYAGQTQHPC